MLVFIAISAVALFLTIKILANELKEMQFRKDDTTEKYIEIYTKNENLNEQFNLSKNKLEEVNKKMLDLEDIIGMKNAIGAEKTTVPFDKNKLDSSNRNLILSLLPSAKPFNLDINASVEFLKTGAKFSIPFDTPIIATADGIVDLVRNDGKNGIGQFVRIVHSFGFTTIYGHLSKIKLKRGNIVKKGDIVGFSGKHNGGDSLFYDVKFLGSEVDLNNFLEWRLDNFEVVMNEFSVVNWDNLLWTFNDMIEIGSHKILEKNTDKRNGK